MGIFIKLEIVPANISKKSWDLAYKEAIQLISLMPKPIEQCYAF